MNHSTKFAISCLFLFGLYSSASATPIVSGDGTETCVNGAPLGAGVCSVQTISVHNAWQPNNPAGNNALWISYADTGVNGSTLAPTSGATSVFSVIETFIAGIGAQLALDVWGDDTAEVFIDGSSVYAPNFTQSTCANGPIGCQPNENGTINYIFTTAGLHSLTFDVFQVGAGTTNRSNPFGLLYSGELTNAVPEPGPLALLALGLLGVGLSRRKVR